jgi:hypothetical protein
MDFEEIKSLLRDHFRFIDTQTRSRLKSSRHGLYLEILKWYNNLRLDFGVALDPQMICNLEKYLEFNLDAIPRDLIHIGYGT